MMSEPASGTMPRRYAKLRVKHHSDTCPHLQLTVTLRTIFKVDEPRLPFAYTPLQRLTPNILR